jgi:divalent metal cation (Fe/Co/Zn/Cd) transporter
MEKIERDPEKNRDPSRIASYSTVLNVLLTLAKATLAWVSGSSALLADTIHGFSDTFASLLVLVGIWLSKKKSEAFPWGLYEVENFVALVSAGLIFFAGYEAKGTFYVFSSAEVDIIPTETKTIEEIYKNLEKIGVP